MPINQPLDTPVYVALQLRRALGANGGGMSGGQKRIFMVK